MVTKKILWIKVPSDTAQADLENISSALQSAFKGSEYGFFIVPDRFDILSRNEVVEFLKQAMITIGDEK